MFRLYKIHILSKFQLHSYFFGDFRAFFVFFRFSAKRLPPGLRPPRAQKKVKNIFSKKRQNKVFLNLSNYLVTKIQVNRSKIGRDILRARARALAQQFRDISYIVKKGHFRPFSAKKRGKILNFVIILHNIILHNNWRPRQDYIWFTGPFYSVL